ncbi:MAG: pyridoxamine 5'-phosphate oxidase family protein [Nocardioides sp.]
MASLYDSISDRHRAFIERQPMFFVATAARGGRVNVSPKGLDSLRVLGPRRVVWLNGTGSGNETAAHLLDANRMTIMFCSFVREPLILRLYGTAREVQPTDTDWPELFGLFPPMRGARQLYDVDVDLVQTSCGYGVPLMEETGQRDLMDRWAEKKGEDGLAAYHAEKNLESIDGLPTGLRVPTPDRG